MKKNKRRNDSAPDIRPVGVCFKYDSASITRHHTLGEPEFK